VWGSRCGRTVNQNDIEIESTERFRENPLRADLCGQGSLCDAQTVRNGRHERESEGGDVVENRCQLFFTQEHFGGSI